MVSCPLNGLATRAFVYETDDGLVVYVDPWSDVLTDEPGDGDVVFVTYDDFDHYDPEAIEAVASDDADIVAYEGSLTVQGITVEAVPAHNRADGEHVDEDSHPFHTEREVVGLLLGFDESTVYFTSDTDFLPAHNHIQATVFIPPIGGHYTMDRHEAADFAESVEPELVLAVHYDTFEAIETDAEAFAEDIEPQGVTVELF